jgi:hypothetical protein
MAADAWCGRGAGAAMVRVRSRGNNSESMGLPATVHASGDRTRFGLLLGRDDAWDAYLL